MENSLYVVDNKAIKYINRCILPNFIKMKSLIYAEKCPPKL
jgi:hypothetical protein